MDRFDDKYMNSSFPLLDEPEEYSTCSGCGQTIYVGDECLDIFGMAVHDERECILRAVDAKRVIASKEEI